jgi:hypothetical protein
MDGCQLQKYYTEESSNLSLLKLGRLPEEIELSPLISNLVSSLTELFKDEITNEDDWLLLKGIIENVTECLKHEYKKTIVDLKPTEFYLWHISMFMTIRTYITIVESKYRLNDSEEITDLFLCLLKKDFLSFLESNEKRMSIGGVKDVIRQIPNALDIILRSRSTILGKYHRKSLSDRWLYLDNKSVYNDFVKREEF